MLVTIQVVINEVAMKVSLYYVLLDRVLAYWFLNKLFTHMEYKSY